MRNFSWIYKVRPGMRLLTWFALALPALSQTPANSFQEFFDSPSPSSQWTIKSSGADTLRWWNPADSASVYGTTPGFFGRNDAGTGIAYAPWALNAAPFNFQFDIYPVSIWQKQSAAGLMVALSTAVPGSMSSSDTSIVMGFWSSGPMVDLRTGELTTIFSVPSNSAEFLRGSLSREWRWMNGGKGGTGGAGFDSFPWPQASNSGPIPYWRWTVQVTRDSSNQLTWNFSTDQYKNGSAPYYSYRMTIPDGHTADNFKYVSLLTLKPQSFAPYQAAVKVTNLRGWSGVPDSKLPVISSILPGGGAGTFQSGQTVLINGSNFTADPPYILRIGQGSSLQTVTLTYVSDTLLKADLPTEAAGTYQVHLQRNGIDAEYYPGIAYSPPALYRIDPFEVPVSPISDDDATVQFYGTGFDPSSTVTIGSHPAFMTYISPVQLSVVVPTGVTGSPRIVVTAAKGTVVVYDSSVSSTYPPSGKLNFGYAPHPYLQFNSGTLASLQAKWTDPNYAAYVNPLIQSVTSGTGQGSGPAGEPDFWDLGYGIALSGDTSTYPLFKSLLASAPLGGPGLPSGELNRLQFTVPYANWSMFLYNYASQIAQFYDQFFPVMTPTERSAYLNYLQNALGYYYYVIHTNDNEVSGSAGWHNRVAIANAGAGVVALSVINSLQSVRGYSIAAPWVATTGRIESTGAAGRLKKWFANAWTADGGYAEGPLYAGYGTGAALIFTHALENTNTMLGVTPADGGMFSSGGNFFANFQNWVNSLWDGTQWSTFDDSQPQAYLVSLMLDADNRFGLPNLTYLADYLKTQIVNGNGIYRNTVFGASSAGGDSAAYALMWRNSNFPSSFTGFPALQVNPVLQQAALRSDSSLATQFYIGIKGSSNQEVGTNLHHQNDTASFVVQSRGELFLIDPGYYLPGALNHSILSIDGVTPGTSNASVGVMDSTANLSTPTFRSATIDATRAYAGVSAFRRVFAMYANGTSQLGLILDDVQTSGTGSVVSYYQSGQNTNAKSSNGFILTGNFSKLNAMFDGPPRTVSAAAGAPSFHLGTSANSWIYDALSCQFPADPWCATTIPKYLQKYTTVKAEYTASADNPLLTLIAPAGMDGSGSTATVDRSTAGIINVTMSDGAYIQFSRLSGVWRVSATSTDAVRQ